MDDGRHHQTNKSNQRNNYHHQYARTSISRRRCSQHRDRRRKPVHARLPTWQRTRWHVKSLLGYMFWWISDHSGLGDYIVLTWRLNDGHVRQMTYSSRKATALWANEKLHHTHSFPSFSYIQIYIKSTQAIFHAPQQQTEQPKFHAALPVVETWTPQIHFKGIYDFTQVLPKKDPTILFILIGDSHHHQTLAIPQKFDPWLFHSIPILIWTVHVSYIPNWTLQARAPMFFVIAVISLVLTARLSLKHL